MTTKPKLNSVFEEYFSQQAARKKAITPDQKKALTNKLRQELLQEGRLPLPAGPVRFDVQNLTMRAAILAGSPVSLPEM